MTVPEASVPKVRQAGPGDALSLARLLAVAFYLDPVSRFIFPDERDRMVRHTEFFRPFVDLVLERGRADVAGDFDGMALWLDVADAPPEPDVARIEEACGPNWDRAAGLFAVFDERHPADPHAYLPFVAVAPDRWGQGIGTALLEHRAGELDAAGRSAYLEASSERNAELYRRLGYADLGEPIVPPDGPPLYPMWREPRT